MEIQLGHSQICLLLFIVVSAQTGKYVLRAEDLPRANKLSCAQRSMKRAKFEKYTCQVHRLLREGTSTYGEALGRWFFPSAQIGREIISSIKFRGTLLWNSIPDLMKRASSAALFKRNIKNWSGEEYHCKICK